MKHKIILSSLVLIALLLTVFQVAPPSIFSDEQQNQNIEKNKLIATHVYDALLQSIEKPITISQTMKVDELLKIALKNETSINEKDMESLMSSFLSNIKEQFGYIATFVVSEQTHRYYTPQGIAKIVNPERDPYDDWYKFFIASNKDYKLDTDRDEVYNYRWTVFVNARITDEDGTLLGVCGVGVFMDELQEVISAAEKNYGIKINMIDKTGLVQVDSNSKNIESAYITDAIKDNATSADFTYNKNSFGGYRITRYMEALDWFIVVQTFDKNEAGSINKGAAILLYLLLIAAIIFSLLHRDKIVSRISLTGTGANDPLTGLPNRNYLNEFYGEQGIFNTTRYKSLAMFDIDRFKTTNQNRDGNKILLEIVRLTKECVDEHGIIFRWAGDEFVIFLEMDIKEAESKFMSLCRKIEETLGVTISAGIVKVDLSENIKTNYHRAVQLCYAVKANGGNGVFVEK